MPRPPAYQVTNRQFRLERERNVAAQVSAEEKAKALALYERVKATLAPSIRGFFAVSEDGQRIVLSDSLDYVLANARSICGADHHMFKVGSPDAFFSPQERG